MISLDRQGEILVLTLDAPGEAVIKLNRALGDELQQMIADIGRDTSVRGVVLASAKPDSFIAGADIEEFLEFHREEEAARASQIGQGILGQLEALRVPVVAAIHGACLGGGLEVALACRYRICTDHPKTLLAVP